MVGPKFGRAASNSLVDSRKTTRRLRIAVTTASIVAVAATGVPVSAAPQAVPETKPIYSYQNAIREDVYVEAPMDSDNDGKPDRIAIQIMRPKETGTGLKTPVIMEPSPYYGLVNARTDRQMPVGFDGWYDEFFVPRGYTVIEAEMQGTSRSQGCPTTGGPEDTISIKAVVDWLNGRAKAYYANGSETVASWSTGAVGMAGVSYNGTLPNAVAATGVEGLKTIVPIAAISSWYDYARATGIGYTEWGHRYPEFLAKWVASSPALTQCADTLKALGDNAADDTSDYTPFWATRNYRPDAGKVKASVLLVHGMEDWNVKPGQGVLWWDQLQKHGVPRKIWLHRDGHIDPVQTRSREWKRQLHRWMDHWLFGMDNGIMKEPMADIQRPNGTWETHRSWPDTAARTTRLNFGPAGSGVAGTLGERRATGTQSFTDKSTQTEKTAMADYAVTAPNRLVYVTKPVAGDVRMSGTSRVNVTVQSNTTSAPLTALLVDYGPGTEYSVADFTPIELMTQKCDLVDVDQQTGCAEPRAERAMPVTAKVITRGAIDLKNHSSMAVGTPLVPGRKYQVSWELHGKDYVVPAGHRIGLVLMANNKNYIQVDTSAKALTVQLDASSLDIPVVGGRI
ncbi:X-Pro dipeptidyl-peptidase [Kibdelosporangium banguiense]|uniref:Xaa-Pro dipeptidyl-peptidase n=1 Tax=Kibdelosporangium banguiense TaxID=1365924 RepID=A0ABS4TYE6_9PSEU|nr:Xaa-Pro dipeptidyl-peptidase [Kibdelosporangium banguiense]MBP2329004.1 X-Pro dipeptidyl-peptidase [Kibdelosporangium banguiense]